jgi:type VI secretion system secreted protein Hcp
MKDIYVKFTKKTNSKDIPGESLDSDHKDWVEVTSWSQGVSQPTSETVSSSGGHATERCVHSPMTFLKTLDKSSAYMYEACSAGYAYDIEIQFLRASGTVRTNYFTVKLTNAIIASIQTTISEGGFPTDIFTVKYAKVTWEHKGSKTSGEANVGKDVGGWDLALNKSAA